MLVSRSPPTALHTPRPAAHTIEIVVEESRQLNQVRRLGREARGILRLIPIVRLQSGILTVRAEGVGDPQICRAGS